jgi:pimeloyl-ACP methyl ester carboxylesterase
VYAVRHPERVGLLVIEDIAPGASSAGAGAERIRAEMAMLPESFASWTEARMYWRRHRPTVSDAALEQRLAESLKTLSDGRIGWRYDARGIRKTRMNPDPQRVVDLWPVIERLRMPTLIIRGEHSDFCPAESVAEMKRRNQIIDSVTVAGAGHYVHDEQPAAFITQLKRSLESWRTRERSPSPRAQNTVGE